MIKFLFLALVFFVPSVSLSTVVSIDGCQWLFPDDFVVAIDTGHIYRKPEAENLGVSIYVGNRGPSIKHVFPCGIPVGNLCLSPGLQREEEKSHSLISKNSRILVSVTGLMLEDFRVFYIGNCEAWVNGRDELLKKEAEEKYKHQSQ